MTSTYGVNLHLKHRGAVFEVVDLDMDVTGQFALLPDGDEAHAECDSERRTKDETARLDSGDEVNPLDPLRGQRLDPGSDDRRDPTGIREQRGDVTEVDARDGPVRERANALVEQRIELAPQRLRLLLGCFVLLG